MLQVVRVYMKKAILANRDKNGNGQTLSLGYMEKNVQAERDKY